MIFQSALVLYPIKMSQKFVNLTLRLLVFAFLLLVESRSSTFNITRNTGGDVFQNINSSRSCNDSEAQCDFDGKKSPFCGIDCCYCKCKTENPTYLQGHGTCRSGEQLMSVLKAQSFIQGCSHRAVVAASYSQCHGELLTTLSTRSPGNRSIYLCPWSQKKSKAFLHFQLAMNLLRCEILPNESFYLFNGTWTNFSPDEEALLKLTIGIRPHPSFNADNLFLKWTSDIGKQYDGRILSLKLQCHGKKGNVTDSCVYFKKSGSLTDFKPTFKPSVKSTCVTSAFVQRNTTTEAATITSASIPGEVSVPSTAHTQTIVVTSLTDHPQKFSVIVTALVALAAALFVVLTTVVVIFLLWKRKRRFEVESDTKTASNPVYQRGASDTLKMAKITNRGCAEEEECPEYQPLVENTKPAERTDSLPGYRTLSVGRRPNQDSNQGVRSSNYLSLIQEDTEEGKDYQTLVKDANSKLLETVDEEKIPDYQELEERSDSDDSFEPSPHQSLDSYLDYEEPPAEAILKKIRSPAPRKQQINDLSSDFHDYDKPEGVIVLSDHEDNNKQAIKDNTDFHDYADPDDNIEQAIKDNTDFHDYADPDDNNEQAIKDNSDFHDYADPDDTDKDNTNCHVIAIEDASCYHDYDDPAE